MSEHDEFSHLRGGGDPEIPPTGGQRGEAVGQWVSTAQGYEFDHSDGRQLAGAIRGGSQRVRGTSGKEQTAERRVDRETAQPLLDVLQLAAQGAQISKTEIDKLTVRSDLSSYQARVWRNRVADAAEEIAALRSEGANAAARQLARAAAGELGTEMAADRTDPHVDIGDDPAALAELIRGERARHGKPLAS
jgi:hypothetical protein